MEDSAYIDYCTNVQQRSTEEYKIDGLAYIDFWPRLSAAAPPVPQLWRPQRIWSKKISPSQFFLLQKTVFFLKNYHRHTFFLQKIIPITVFFSKNYHHNGLKFRLTKTKKIKDRGSGSFLFCFCIIQQISTHLWTFTMSFILCCSLWFIGKWWTWSVFIWLMWP